MALGLSTALRLVAALTGAPDITAPQSDLKLLWFIVQLHMVSGQLRDWEVMFPGRILFSIWGFMFSHPSPITAPLCAAPHDPHQGQKVERCWTRYRLQNPIIFSSLFVTILQQKWQPGEAVMSFWDTASVNYPTCTLQPFLVFATGEKSSFRERGEKKIKQLKE